MLNLRTSRDSPDFVMLSCTDSPLYLSRSVKRATWGANFEDAMLADSADLLYF